MTGRTGPDIPPTAVSSRARLLLVVGAFVLLGAGPSEAQKIRAAEKQAGLVVEHAATIHGLIDAADEDGRPLRLAEIRSAQVELHQAVIRLEGAVRNLDASATDLH